MIARAPDAPTAFTRRRKLPLPALIAALLSANQRPQQRLIDDFFAALSGSSLPVRLLSDRGFAKTRAQLDPAALHQLNAELVAQADQLGLVSRWRGLRVVAGDGSVLSPALRRCHVKRAAIEPNHRLFALFLPGAELLLHAEISSYQEAERAQLMRSLDRLNPDHDVLVLDRGYPAHWLINALDARGLKYVMRCDAMSFAAVRAFIRCDADEALVDLGHPRRRDVKRWAVSAQSPRVRLIRQISPSGQIRVLMTNVGDEIAPADAFAALYHQRWRIEEAFKRLKHRLHLECVSGLTQQALEIDVGAKMLADNLAALLCLAVDAINAIGEHETTQRRCNRTFLALTLARWLPRYFMRLPQALGELLDLLRLLTLNTHRVAKRTARPRTSVRSHHEKHHPSLCYR